MNALLIVNPLSYSLANGRLAAQAIAVAKRHGAGVLEARGPEAIAAGLDGALARGTRRVVVLSGDGTVQAVADYLAALPAGIPQPQLLLLAGGRTNLTAADLDGRGAVLAKLDSALARSAGDPVGGFRVQHRHTLMVEQAPAPPRHGFFVAAALVDAAIRRCHHYRQGGGWFRSSRFGTTWCLLKAAIPALRGRAPFASPELDVDVPGRGRLRGSVRLLVATTLAHERQWFNPYAERGKGIVRLTAVAAGARRFWRSLPRLLSGRLTPAMDLDGGYLSGRCDGFTVHGLDGYTIDGQSFRTDPAREVTVRSGVRLEFLLP